jgi:hypothetical protein
VPASPQAQHRLAVILRTIAGDMTVSEACTALGIGTSRFHALRKAVLRQAAEALEPRPPGRPVQARHEELESLRADRMALGEALRAATLREEIARIMPEVVHPPPGRAQTRSTRARGEKDRPEEERT